MKFDYNRILVEKFYELQDELGLGNFNFEVDDEQAFLKKKDLAPNTIYVLTKELQNDNSINVETQPVQIMILSEQNSLDVAKAFFSEFAKRNNFIAINQTYTENNVGHNLWIKQQYSDPVVLSNFNTVAFGYRSVLYISATLYIMKDVVDISNLTINNEDIEALNFSISYSMSTNTQQLPSEYIASSMKTVSTFAITMTIPMIKGTFVGDVLNILNEDQTEVDGNGAHFDGNNVFTIAFRFGVSKEDEAYHVDISKDMRLISVQIITAPNQVPSLQLGFMK